MVVRLLTGIAVATAGGILGAEWCMACANVSAVRDARAVDAVHSDADGWVIGATLVQTAGGVVRADAPWHDTRAVGLERVAGRDARAVDAEPATAAWIADCFAFGVVSGLVVLVFALRAGRGTVLVTWLVALLLGGFARASQPPLPRGVVTCGKTRDATGRRFGRYLARIDGPSEWVIRDGGKTHLRVVVVLEAEACDGLWQPRDGRALVSLWDGPEVVRGDVIALKLAVEPIDEPRNPTERDPRTQALLEDVAWRVSVGSAHLLVRHGERAAERLFAIIDHARRTARVAFDGRLPRSPAAIAKGLVMGDRGGMTPLERDAWADAGVAHLLAVSGMHVTIVVLTAFGAVRWISGLAGCAFDSFGERIQLRALGAAAGIPCAVWFCLWSASPSSAVRATVMGGVALTGRVMGFESSALAALGVTGFCMLLHTPMLLHDAGFGLSVAAVGALLVLPRRRPRGPWLVRHVKTALLASTAATLATLPITAASFGRVALVAPLSNLLAVPLGAGVATPLAIATVVAHPISSSVADLCARLTAWCVVGLDWIVRRAASVPVLNVSEPTLLQQVGYAFVLLGLTSALYAPKRTHAAWVATGVLLAFFPHEPLFGPKRDRLVIELPYVNQGDAALVRYPLGTTMLIDAGGNVLPSDWEPGRSVIAPLLRFRAIRALDYAVVTHPHPDHIGGLAYLAPRVPIREVWRTGQAGEHPVLQMFRDRAQAPRSIDIEGVRVEVLHPLPTFLEEFNLNDNSIVLKLTYGARSILFTGDVERLAEDVINWPHAEIVKVPHHGSRTSSTERMIEAVQPNVAIMCRGEHNAFGFPHSEVVERYRGRGVRILDTAKNGSIFLTTNGIDPWQITTYRQH
ncbi:MAG: DNA internalization-related competence protein ComEC/Rec2 [Clostridia bacterium]|nr:DNA internalization-related competence protein ComEC/Rec2 [Deltaproteobacteria bacterium]